MTHPSSPIDSPLDDADAKADARLEAELMRLRPQALRPGLEREILDPMVGLSQEEEAALDDLADRLGSQWRPARLPATSLDTLWSGIQRSLEESESSEKPVPEISTVQEVSAQEDTRVIPFPHWRDFAPVFRVAAAIALGVFIAGAWFHPGPESGSGDPIAQEQGSTWGPLANPSGEAAPRATPDSGQVVPIGRRGSIQDMESRGVMERDNQLYERYWQTRKDRSMYRVGDDLRIEDEVSREGPVITPLRTF